MFMFGDYSYSEAVEVDMLSSHNVSEQTKEQRASQIKFALRGHDAAILSLLALGATGLDSDDEDDRTRRGSSVNTKDGDLTPPRRT